MGDFDLELDDLPSRTARTVCPPTEGDSISSTQRRPGRERRPARGFSPSTTDNAQSSAVQPNEGRGSVGSASQQSDASANSRSSRRSGGGGARKEMKGEEDKMEEEKSKGEEEVVKDEEEGMKEEDQSERTRSQSGDTADTSSSRRSTTRKSLSHSRAISHDDSPATSRAAAVRLLHTPNYGGNLFVEPSSSVRQRKANSRFSPTPMEKALHKNRISLGEGVRAKSTPQRKNETHEPKGGAASFRDIVPKMISYRRSEQDFELGDEFEAFATSFYRKVHIEPKKQGKKPRAVGGADASSLSIVPHVPIGEDEEEEKEKPSTSMTTRRKSTGTRKKEDDKEDTSLSRSGRRSTAIREVLAIEAAPEEVKKEANEEEEKKPNTRRKSIKKETEKEGEEKKEEKGRSVSRKRKRAEAGEEERKTGNEDEEKKEGKVDEGEGQPVAKKSDTRRSGRVPRTNFGLSDDFVMTGLPKAIISKMATSSSVFPVASSSVECSAKAKRGSTKTAKLQSTEDEEKTKEQEKEEEEDTKEEAEEEGDTMEEDDDDDSGRLIIDEGTPPVPVEDAKMEGEGVEEGEEPFAPVKRGRGRPPRDPTKVTPKRAPALPRYSLEPSSSRSDKRLSAPTSKMAEYIADQVTKVKQSPEAKKSESKRKPSPPPSPIRAAPSSALAILTKHRSRKATSTRIRTPSPEERKGRGKEAKKNEDSASSSLSLTSTISSYKTTIPSPLSSLIAAHSQPPPKGVIIEQDPVTGELRRVVPPEAKKVKERKVDDSTADTELPKRHASQSGSALNLSGPTDRSNEMLEEGEERSAMGESELKEGDEEMAQTDMEAMAHEEYLEKEGELAERPSRLDELSPSTVSRTSRRSHHTPSHLSDYDLTTTGKRLLTSPTAKTSPEGKKDEKAAVEEEVITPAVKAVVVSRPQSIALHSSIAETREKRTIRKNRRFDDDVDSPLSSTTSLTVTDKREKPSTSTATPDDQSKRKKKKEKERPRIVLKLKRSMLGKEKEKKEVNEHPQLDVPTTSEEVVGGEGTIAEVTVPPVRERPKGKRATAADRSKKGRRATLTTASLPRLPGDIRPHMGEIELDSGIIESLTQQVANSIDCMLLEVCQDGIHSSTLNQGEKSRESGKLQGARRRHVQQLQHAGAVPIPKLFMPPREGTKRIRHPTAPKDYGLMVRGEHDQPFSPLAGSPLSTKKEERKPLREARQSQQPLSPTSSHHRREHTDYAGTPTAKKGSITVVDRIIGGEARSDSPTGAEKQKKKKKKDEVDEADRISLDEMLKRKSFGGRTIGRVLEEPSDLFYRELFTDNLDTDSSPMPSLCGDDIDVCDGIDDDPFLMDAQGVGSGIGSKSGDLAQKICRLFARPRPFSIKELEGEDADELEEEEGKEREWGVGDIGHAIGSEPEKNRVLMQRMLDILRSQRNADLAVLTKAGSTMRGGQDILYNTYTRNAVRFRDIIPMFSEERRRVAGWLHRSLLRLLPEYLLASYLELLRFLRQSDLKLVQALNKAVLEPDDPEYMKVFGEDEDAVENKENEAKEEEVKMVEEKTASEPPSIDEMELSKVQEEKKDEGEEKKDEEHENIPEDPSISDKTEAMDTVEKETPEASVIGVPTETPSTTVSHEVPTETPSTTVPQEAPTETPSITVPQEVPTDTAPATVPQEAPTNTLSTTVPQEVPIETPSTTVSHEVPTETPSTTVPEEIPTETPSTTVPEEIPTETAPVTVPQEVPIVSVEEPTVEELKEEEKKVYEELKPMSPLGDGEKMKKSRRLELSDVHESLNALMDVRVRDPNTDIMNQTIDIPSWHDVCPVVVSPMMSAVEGGKDSEWPVKNKACDFFFRLVKCMAGDTSMSTNIKPQIPAGECSVAEAMDSAVEYVAARVRKLQTRMVARSTKRRVVLFGWGTSCYICHRVSQLVHGITAIVDFAFPFETNDGWRGTADDDLLLTYCPTLFVIGERAHDFNPFTMLHIKQAMNQPCGFVVVGDGDDNLNVSTLRLSRERITQRVAARMIMDQVVAFVDLPANQLERARLVPPVVNNVFSVDPNALKNFSAAEAHSALVPSISRRGSGTGTAIHSSSSASSMAASPYQSSQHVRRQQQQDEKRRKRRLDESSSVVNRLASNIANAPAPAPVKRVRTDDMGQRMYDPRLPSPLTTPTPSSAPATGFSTAPTYGGYQPAQHSRLLAASTVHSTATDAVTPSVQPPTVPSSSSQSQVSSLPTPDLPPPPPPPPLTLPPPQAEPPKSAGPLDPASISLSDL